MPATYPWQLTIAEAARLIRERQLSPVALVQSCLDRIEALEPRVQAWALVDREGALAAARRCEQALAQGIRPGPLFGIPTGVKDIFYTAGQLTQAGSKAMAGYVPAFDATAVARLREAGAVILGKTHTTEFALFDPAPTRNPWDLECTPGGSSSGSGAAVAAGMCPAALGSQTAGSVLRPAAFNGVVGLKPRHGRVSCHGVIPLAWTLDHVGVLTRTVEDAALVIQAIAGYDASDPYALNEPAPDYLAALARQRTPPRLGLLRDYFFEKASEEQRQHTESVVAKLRDAGARVDEVPLPESFAGVREVLTGILHTECAAYHRERYAARKAGYRPRIAALIERGLAASAVDYAAALQRRRALRREVAPLIAPYDAVVTPGAAGPAPRDLTTTGDPAMQTPWSVLGFPSISLPTGLSRERLPLALQLAAAPEDELRLLWTAQWCEQALGVRLQIPLA